MPSNNEIYRQKADEVIREVYRYEYLNSLGIPLPQILLLTPDSPNYVSGQYYIQIGDTWQICLNLGALPVSFKEFQEEIRVITRHEIEHYMCCPYDVITQLRMINAIINTYNSEYSHLGIDINQLAGSLANQAADIIVDTKNFQKYKKETLKSEISWIKNSIHESVQDIPNHAKLLFLTKEALWGENLEIENNDEFLKREVLGLAKIFDDGGITNRDLFVQKTTAYVKSFFSIYQKDEKEKHNSHEPESNTPQKSAQKPQSSPLKSESAIGDHFVFQSPEKIREALDQFAQESTLEQFTAVISAAGIENLDDKTKMQIWFEANNEGIIPIQEMMVKGNSNNYTYPTVWKIGDPIEEIDMMLSFTLSPKIIPGITTKKWVPNYDIDYGNEKKPSSLLLVIDTSGSMGKISKANNLIHQSVLASYGILKYYESISSMVALISFSDRITALVEWSKDYDLIRQKLLLNGNGGTNFPTHAVSNMISKSKTPIVTVVITDGELHNLTNTIQYFLQYLSDGNKLYLFLQSNQTVLGNYAILSKHGAKVSKCLTAEEIRKTVLNDEFLA